MKVLIIEDEALSARRLKTMLMEIDSSFTVLGITESVKGTVEWLRNHPMPDLLLMDIELTDGKSFDIFEQMEVRCPVIFITAYDEYAIRAFKVNSIDYLLKPVKQEELNRSLEKFRQIHQPAQREKQGMDIQALLQEFIKQSGYKERFLIRQGDRLLPVDTQVIAYFQTKDKINFIHTIDNQVYAVDQSLDEIEKALDPKLFFRANRQFILSAPAVKKIHFWFSSKLKVDVLPSPGEEVIISREKAIAFRAWMGE
jgi:two-component system LytT family response regulator